MEIDVILKALKDVDVVDIFQVEHHFNKGKTVTGKLRQVSDEMTTIRLEFIKGQDTFYVIEDLEEYFEIINKEDII